MICCNCKKDFGEIAGYQVTRLNVQWDFCGRICLMEGMGSNVTSAIVLKQWIPEGKWIPTDEEAERMSQ